MTNISTHFTQVEAACPMTGKILMEKGFLEDAEALRSAYNHPMIVTSWCRTSEYNQDLLNRGYAASPNSFHLIGNQKYRTDNCAFDIARPNAQDLRLLLSYAIKMGWSIGLAKTFVHLDQRWSYANLDPVFYTY